MSFTITDIDHDLYERLLSPEPPRMALTCKYEAEVFDRPPVWRPWQLLKWLRHYGRRKEIRIVRELTLHNVTLISDD